LAQKPLNQLDQLGEIVGLAQCSRDEPLLQHAIKDVRLHGDKRDFAGWLSFAGALSQLHAVDIPGHIHIGR